MLHLEKLFYYSILKITTKLKKELSEKVYMYQDVHMNVKVVIVQNIGILNPVKNLQKNI